MYEKEKQDLLDLKKQMDYLPVPTGKVSEAIQMGFIKAKKRKKSRALKYWGLATAAILLVSCVSLVRVSPTFANVLSTIPGAEKIINLIRNDKGFMSAVENDFLQPVGLKVESKGVEITVESLIIDHHDLVVFYKVDVPEEERDQISISNIELIVDDKEKDELNIGYDPISAREGKRTSVRFKFDESLNEESDVKISFVVEKNDDLLDTFSLPLNIDHSIYKNQHKEINVNKTVKVDNQNITITKVDTYPLSMVISIKYDKENTKQVFGLENIRVVDEKGEEWGNGKGGVSASYINDNEHLIYVESNYFHTSKELYIVFDGIHAINKDDTTIQIDEKNGQLIKYPMDGIIQSAKIEGKEIVIQIDDQGENGDLSIDSVTDDAGQDINGHRQSFISSEGLNQKEIRVEYQPEKVTKGPLNLEIGSYPLTHKQQVKLRIK